MDAGNQPTTQIKHGIDVVIANSQKRRLRKHVAPVPHWHRLDAASTAREKLLIQTYTDCHARGFLVLIVTLSTEVTSDYAAASEKFCSLWDKHFLQKVEKRLPKNSRSALFIHDYETQKSDGQTFVDTRSGSFWQSGYWHFHGLLAVHPSVGDRLWKDGSLNYHLANDLSSFSSAGKYRPYRVTSFHMEPVVDVKRWVEYMLRYTDQPMETA